MEIPSSPAAVPHPAFPERPSSGSIFAIVALVVASHFLFALHLATRVTTTVETSTSSLRTPQGSVVVVRTESRCDTDGCTTTVERRAISRCAYRH